MVQTVSFVRCLVMFAHSPPVGGRNEVHGTAGRQAGTELEKEMKKKRKKGSHGTQRFLNASRSSPSPVNVCNFLLPHTGTLHTCM